MDLTIELIKLIAISIIMAFVFGLIRVAKKNMETGEPWDWLKFAPTAIYSIALGFIMAWTGIVNFDNLSNFQSLFDGTWILYLSLNTFILYVWENMVIPFIKARLTITKMYPMPAGIDPLSKMNAETRHWLVSDFTPEMGAKILSKVDEAEAAKTYRYDVNAVSWEYLVEFGIVTGGKHYLWKGWFGDGAIVIWKAISSACLEAIRSTGKWPDYEKLY